MSLHRNDFAWNAITVVRILGDVSMGHPPPEILKGTVPCRIASLNPLVESSNPLIKSSGRILWSNPLVDSSDRILWSSHLIKSSDRILWSNPLVASVSILINATVSNVPEQSALHSTVVIHGKNFRKRCFLLYRTFGVKSLQQPVYWYW